MSRLKDDWAVAYLLSSYNWEELVAVAFEIRQEQKRGDVGLLLARDTLTQRKKDGSGISNLESIAAMVGTSVRFGPRSPEQRVIIIERHSQSPQ